MPSSRGPLAVGILACAAALAVAHGVASDGPRAGHAGPRVAGQPAGPNPLTGPESLLARVRRHNPAGYRFAIDHGARVFADPATRGFAVASTRPAHPRRLVVVVHGHNTNTFSEYKAWQPYLAGRGYGLVAVEWQLHFGVDTTFLDPQSTYDLIARAVRREGVPAGHVLLHGFSQGSHEAFALTAIDRVQRRLFGLTLAESGGASDDPASPSLRGSRWVLYCAGHDQFAEIAGCPAMRAAARYLLASHARVDRFLTNPTGRHGSFLHDPLDVKRALADFARLAG